jgi:hypothetical protein
MTYLSGLPNMPDTMSSCTSLCAWHPDRRYHTVQLSLLPVPARHRTGLMDFIMASNVPPALN